MKLAFTTLGCPEWTLRQIVENAAHMGYDAVDFRGLLEDVDITVRPEFTTGLEETRRTFADHGVAISSLSTSARYAVADPAEREKHFDETRRYMALAARLGVGILRVFGGRVPEGHTVETILPILVENLRQMGDEAEQFDVTLALETHDDWTDSATLARVMAKTDHLRVGVLWDLHHPFRTNGEAPEASYANLAPYVVNTHVKDSVPGRATNVHNVPSDYRPEYSYVFVGQGDVPLRHMLDLLAQGGYDGYATLEWEKRWLPHLPEPEEAFPEYVRQMREWFPRD
jgi:sugar phosphate isomerase/epimerase